MDSSGPGPVRQTGSSLPAAACHARLFALTLRPDPSLPATPNLFRKLRLRFEYWLFDLPEEMDSRTLPLVVGPLRYAYALFRDFIRGDLGLRAMGLVYSSLFALVPIVAVSFSVLKAFGYHRELEPVLFEFLRPLGVKGYELTANIMQFVENTQTTVIGTVGVVILLYTAFVMIQKVEDALNFTWHVERPRSLGKRITEYLIVMLIGPVDHRGVHGADDTNRSERRNGSALGVRGERHGRPWLARSLRPVRAGDRPVLVRVLLHAEHARALAIGVHRRAVRRRHLGGARRSVHAHRGVLHADGGDLRGLRHRAAVPGLAARQLAGHAARRAAVVLHAASRTPAQRPRADPDDERAARTHRTGSHVPARPAFHAGW